MKRNITLNSTIISNVEPIFVKRCKNFILAIIKQAIYDYKYPNSIVKKDKTEAKYFINSKYMTKLCNLVGINANYIRNNMHNVDKKQLRNIE